MKLHFRVGIAATALTLAMAALVGLGGAAANAAPAGCSGPDAPPACFHTPPAHPPAPDVLETPTFTPRSGETNLFDIAVKVNPLVLAGYSSGATTSYHVSVNCSNGYSVSAALTTMITSGGSLLYANFIASANAAAGTCSATTWDQHALGLTTASTRLYDASEDDRFWGLSFS
ncbi:hypothetical protein [Subtercola lobariae]|uniref:Spore-associated protein A n=1 Tax=Subtercola lobariae TaxID=1588641 RepID=A0A917B5X9_9MICO|nr:hypothetical protein [Subtercola lobariae]GGF24791.1 hypothetical protein GCM10011399_17850 [Subtercola lobariae]